MDISDRVYEQSIDGSVYEEREDRHKTWTDESVVLFTIGLIAATIGGYCLWGWGGAMLVVGSLVCVGAKPVDSIRARRPLVGGE